MEWTWLQNFGPRATKYCWLLVDNTSREYITSGNITLSLNVQGSNLVCHQGACFAGLCPCFKCQQYLAWSKEDSLASIKSRVTFVLPSATTNWTPGIHHGKSLPSRRMNTLLVYYTCHFWDSLSNLLCFLCPYSLCKSHYCNVVILLLEWNLDHELLGSSPQHPLCFLATTSV